MNSGFLHKNTDVAGPYANGNVVVKLGVSAWNVGWAIFSDGVVSLAGAGFAVTLIFCL